MNTLGAAHLVLDALEQLAAMLLSLRAEHFRYFSGFEDAVRGVPSHVAIWMLTPLGSGPIVFSRICLPSPLKETE